MAVFDKSKRVVAVLLQYLVRLSRHLLHLVIQARIYTISEVVLFQYCYWLNYYPTYKFQWVLAYIYIVSKICKYILFAYSMLKWVCLKFWAITVSVTQMMTAFLAMYIINQHVPGLKIRYFSRNLNSICTPQVGPKC